MRAVAVLFPGQGAQRVGMLGRLAQQHPARVRQLLDEANEVCGYDLGARIRDGPAAELARTRLAQPSLLLTSTAYWRTAAQEHVAGAAATYFLGHSVGEYGALVACGALAFADALRLLLRRGELLEACALPAEPTAMAVVTPRGGAAELADAIRARGVDVAAINSPQQLTVSGLLREIRALEAGLGPAIRSLAVLRNVSRPFHSRLLAPAAARYAADVGAARFAPPRGIFVSSVTGRPVADPRELPGLLARQVVATVQWHAAVEYCLGREPGLRFVEVGPGAVLSGLLRRSGRAPPASIVPLDAYK